MSNWLIYQAVSFLALMLFIPAMFFGLCAITGHRAAFPWRLMLPAVIGFAGSFIIQLVLFLTGVLTPK